jgi:hypothetical protein
MPHLFLHFDINETILIGDIAGGDTLEDCLNKIIAKSAFVTKDSDGNDKRDEESFVPTHWWNGDPLTPSTLSMESSFHCEDIIDNNLSVDYFIPPPSSLTTIHPLPPPLYTGWNWPTNTCPYYRTIYKANAKQFTNNNMHGAIYRPVYNLLCSRLLGGVEQTNKKKEKKKEKKKDEQEEEDREMSFDDFVPAFFHTLVHYFPSEMTYATTTNSIDQCTSSSSSFLPPPIKTTLVLRTFGSDRSRVAKCVTDFANGKHPSYPSYRNRQLVMHEEDLLQGRWVKTTNDAEKEGESIYELYNPQCTTKQYTGDDAILDYLQTKSIVFIRDDYDYWRDNNYAPWSGKPIWARMNSHRQQRPIQLRHDHHHILLDDNIHNDPNDGIGAVRVPTISSSYISLRGNDILNMHGKYLIRVPTLRPLLEDDWFICQIENARQRIYIEEEENQQIDNEGEQNVNNSLVLSNRNLTDDDFNDFHTLSSHLQLPTLISSIDLSRNSLKCIPKQIFTYSTSLIHLDVSRNMINKLGPELCQLSNLIRLIALSNNLRMSQISISALCSLQRLELLDLRYNRKLKQVAYDTLQDALSPINTKLDIRVLYNNQEDEIAQSKERAKLSACDRDATLLRSQLEPLSTPQLRKRLEQSFGVTLTDDYGSFGREYIMSTILSCYEKHGPRQIIKVQGIPASSQRIASLLVELNAIPWPTTTRERPKIRAEYYMILQKPGSGISDSIKTKKETAKLTRYQSLFDEAVAAITEIDPTFAQRFTALAVTKNFVGSPHIDTLNVGPFYGLSLGDFTPGGGCIAVECSPFVVAEVNTHGRFGKVDGRFPHWVTPYQGTRYSLIYYVTSGTVEPQTTAIFPSPPSN